LNILPFRKLGIFNVKKFLFQFKEDQLPPTFKKDFTFSKNIKNENLRNGNDFYIPRLKIVLLPPHNFPKIWYENKRHFSKLSNINLISNFKLKELSLCHKLEFFNPYIFTTQCRRP